MNQKSKIFLFSQLHLKRLFSLTIIKNQKTDFVMFLAWISITIAILSYVNLTEFQSMSFLVKLTLMINLLLYNSRKVFNIKRIPAYLPLSNSVRCIFLIIVQLINLNFFGFLVFCLSINLAGYFGIVDLVCFIYCYFFSFTFMYSIYLIQSNKNLYFSIAFPSILICILFFYSYLNENIYSIWISLGGLLIQAWLLTEAEHKQREYGEEIIYSKTFEGTRFPRLGQITNLISRNQTLKISLIYAATIKLILLISIAYTIIIRHKDPNEIPFILPMLSPMVFFIYTFNNLFGFQFSVTKWILMSGGHPSTKLLSYYLTFVSITILADLALSVSFIIVVNLNLPYLIEYLKILFLCLTTGYVGSIFLISIPKENIFAKSRNTNAFILIVQISLLPYVRNVNIYLLTIICICFLTILHFTSLSKLIRPHFQKIIDSQ